MAGSLKWTCHACGYVGFDDGATDGFFYCLRCGSQAEDIIDTGVADEDFVEKGDAGGAIYAASLRRNRPSGAASAAAADVKPEPLSQSQLWDSLETEDERDGPQPRSVKTEEYEDKGFIDGVGPTEPNDFGLGPIPNFDDYFSEVRMRYMMGIQMMMQMQCEALVEKFKVNPLICGLSGTIWLRFVAGTMVFDDGWADEAIHESESQNQGDLEDDKPRHRYEAEPCNLYGQRAVMIWYRSLRKKIPLSCSLAIAFLACHIAREAVLPTDILKWSLEGKLPYFSAYVDIEKHVGLPSSACPLSSSFMFRPSQPVPLQKLESLAASIAQSIGLDLPPVNFYAIAQRYLLQLGLPVDKILPHACHVYEWLMPPDLWLSANELRLPTRICVMSILIVTIRILYNIHGFGYWERSLYTFCGSSPSANLMKNPTCNSKTRNNCDSQSCSLGELGEESVRNSSHVQNSKSKAIELLCNLEAKYDDIADTAEYSKDLPSYLQYCKDVVFAGLEPSFEDYEEENVIEQFWEFYQNQKDPDPSKEDGLGCNNVPSHKRLRENDQCTQASKENKKIFGRGGVSGSSTDGRDSHTDDSSSKRMDGGVPSGGQQGSQNLASDTHAWADFLKGRAVNHLKVDMEENLFCYIPPRVNIKRFDYLHYVRKKDEGSLTYVAHADYYILLRACARAAQVDIRNMHVGALSIERRLEWTEYRIDHCLQLSPPNDSCKFCSDEPQPLTDDLIELSSLNLFSALICFWEQLPY